MFRWLTLLLVTAGCFGSAAVVRAQDNPWSGEPGRFVPWQGNGAWSPYGGYPPMSSPYGSQSPNALDPSTFNPIVNQGPYPRPRTVHEFLPEGDVRGPGYESSLGGTRFRRALESSWFRIDYLNWSLSDPGERLIGSEWRNANARDPLNGYNGPNNLTSTSVVPLARDRDGTVRTDGSGFLIVGEASDLSPFDFENRQGLRFNVGFPTEAGVIEANIWALEKNTDHFRVDSRIDLGFGVLVFPAIPLTNNGQLVDPTIDISAPMILMDDFMHVQFGQEMYGAELNYFRSTVRDNEHFQFDLVGGGRYIRLREDLYIVGQDIETVTNPEILSVASNHIFGPSAGFRAEWSYWLFKFGVDTRLTVGFNRHNNLVRTRDLFAQNRIPIQSDDDHTDFIPVHDLKLYAQAQVTHRLKVRVGYDLLNLFAVSRPQNNIVWDDSGVVDGPVRIRADASNLESFRASGIFVSGEVSLY